MKNSEKNSVEKNTECAKLNNEKLTKDEKKKAKKSMKTPFYKKQGFKYSTMSSVIIVVFIICLVAVNILASFLSDRFTSFSIDMTSSSDYTISDKNKEYIKKIDKEVTILVTCTEQYYTDSYYSSISQYYVDSTNGKYFTQTIALLKNYQKINPNITLKFVDANSPAFSEYKEKYSSSTIYEGDVVVDYTYQDAKGEDKTKFKVLSFDDLYVTEANETDSSVYNITGSAVETQVTSALFYVTSSQTDKIAVVTGYGCTDVSSYMGNLEISGYDYEEISDLAVDNIPKDATMVMLAAPTMDLSESDIKKLDTFLLGNTDAKKKNKYGKSLIYFASSEQYDTPNLDEFLEQWGYTFDEGTVYETDDNYHSSSSNTTLLMADAESDYTADINSNLYYYCNNNRPMKLKFESSGKYYTYEVLKTQDTCVVQPRKAGDNWSANSENTSSYSTVALSRFTTEDPDNEDKPLYSNVLAVSSIDFISSTYTSMSSLGNDELMLSLINTCANRVTETYEVTDKEIDYTTFSPSETQANTIFAVCAIIIPLAAIATGVVMFVRRKRR